MDRPYLEMLLEMATELNASEDLPAMLNAVVDHLPKVLDAKYCSLFVKNASSGDLEMQAHNHPDIGDDPFIAVGKERESIMNLAMTQNRSLVIRDIEEEMGYQNKNKYETKSFMCILIRHQDNVLGVLNLADKPSGGFTKDDMLISSIICELLGAVLGKVLMAAY